MVLPLNWSGFVEHLHALSHGRYPAQYTWHPLDIAAFGGDVLYQLCFVGGSLTLLWLYGFMTLVRRRHWTLLFSITAPAASYALAFLLQVRYSYDRFLIGVFVLLAVATAAAWDALPAQPTRRRRYMTALALLILIESLARVVAVGSLQAHDSRYAVERWLRNMPNPEQMVVLAGPSQYLPRVTVQNGRYSTDHNVLAAGDVVVVNEDYATRYVGTSTERTLADLQAGRWGHVLVMRCPGADASTNPQIRWIRAVGGSGRSNLDKISPPLLVFRKDTGTHPSDIPEPCTPERKSLESRAMAQ